jgi:hypothetical protein
MRAIVRRCPQREHDGIRLIVADEWMVPEAEQFFSRTIEALASAKSGAPQGYAAFRKDVRQVILWRQPGAPPYQRFQQAAVAPRTIALEADTNCYAAWLLHTSGRLHSQAEAHARTEEYLATFEPDERDRIANWLTGIAERESQ